MKNLLKVISTKVLISLSDKKCCSDLVRFSIGSSVRKEVIATSGLIFIIK